MFMNPRYFNERKYFSRCILVFITLQNIENAYYHFKDFF